MLMKMLTENQRNVYFPRPIRTSLLDLLCTRQTYFTGQCKDFTYSLSSFLLPWWHCGHVGHKSLSCSRESVNYRLRKTEWPEYNQCYWELKCSVQNVIYIYKCLCVCVCVGGNRRHYITASYSSTLESFFPDFFYDFLFLHNPWLLQVGVGGLAGVLVKPLPTPCMEAQQYSWNSPSFLLFSSTLQVNRLLFSASGSNDKMRHLIISR